MSNHDNNQAVDLQDIKSVMELFHQVNKQANMMMLKATKNAVVTPEQCRLLFIIDKCKNVNQKQIAEQLKIKPATLTVRLQRLEKSGYILRVVDKQDKRNVRLLVSDEGKELLNQSLEKMKEGAMKLFEGVNKEDIASMMKTFKMINDNLNKIKEKLDDQD